MFRKIKAKIIVGRLEEDFEESKKTYQKFNNWQTYLALLSTLKPHRPFNSLTGEDAIFIAKKIGELNDLEKGFQFLCLTVYGVITEKINDIQTVKEALSKQIDQIILEKEKSN